MHRWEVPFVSCTNGMGHSTMMIFLPPLVVAMLKVPWEDLRYLFGEIMYGGHITDDWDRRLCRTYLEEYMQPNQVRSWEKKNRECGNVILPNQAC